VRNSSTLGCNGIVEANGGGDNRTLAITNYSAIGNTMANGTEETNGWYAVNHGRLVLKPIPVSGYEPGKYWADNTTLDLVNAVKLQLFASSGSIQGSLYAPDHVDVPKMSGSPVGIWRFEGVTANPAHLTFRYDHAAAVALGVAEGDLKVYSHAGAADDKWTQITEYGIDTGLNTIVASNMTSLAFFAVGDNIQSPLRGTLVLVQ